VGGHSVESIAHITGLTKSTVVKFSRRAGIGFKKAYGLWKSWQKPRKTLEERKDMPEQGVTRARLEELQERLIYDRFRAYLR
jgi:hypothetical protein